MNRKLSSLICASVALLCSVCNEASVKAQTYNFGSSNSTSSTDTSSTSSAGTSSALSSGMGGTSKYANNVSGNAYVNNVPITYGTTIPPAWAFGGYCGNACGTGCRVSNWYQCNFGGPMCNGFNYGSPFYDGPIERHGCCFRRGCGSGCQSYVTRTTAGCCSPMASCCGANPGGTVMIQSGTTVSAPVVAPPTPLSTTTAPTPMPAKSALPADATNPADSTQSPKPVN